MSGINFNGFIFPKGTNTNQETKDALSQIAGEDTSKAQSDYDSKKTTINEKLEKLNNKKFNWRNL